MEYYFLSLIFILGTLFGSFSSVIISRLKTGKGGIMTGRSECPNCKHLLSWKDLFPVFSYLQTGGKCRYCSKKISKMYPILEFLMGFAFLLSAIFLIDINLVLLLDGTELLKLGFYLLLTFLTVIFVIYDILYLEIPESVLLIGILSTLGILSYQTLTSNEIIYTIPTFLQNTPELINYISIGIGFISIFALYLIMLKGFKEIYDFLILILIGVSISGLYFYSGISPLDIPILDGLIGALAIFTFFFIQIVFSNGKWMGGGDLRIAILMGLILGTTYSFAGALASYLAGSIIGIIIIINKKIELKRKEKKNILKRIKKALGLKVKEEVIDTQIPFGPFLAIGLFVILYWGTYILDILDI